MKNVFNAFLPRHKSPYQNPPERRYQKRNDNDTEYENCVLCGCKTNVRIDTPVNDRCGYVDACGQLCAKCYRSLFERTCNSVSVRAN